VSQKEASLFLPAALADSQILSSLKTTQEQICNKIIIKIVSKKRNHIA